MTTLVELKAQYRREVGDSLQAYEWAADVADLYPLTLRFPADAQVAVVAGRCRRLPDGTIEATFNTQQELAWALAALGCDRPEVMEVLQ